MNIKIKRLLSVVIDGSIVYFILWLFSLTQYIFDENIANIIGIIVTMVFIFIIIPRKDCIIGYESIGKKIMGLKIYQNGERVKNKKILIKRITEGFFGIPFYPIYILIDNKSLGDQKMNTVVK